MEEEETEVDNKIKDKRKDSKIDNQIIRIQKPALKIKSEESTEDVKEQEIPEPGKKFCNKEVFFYLFASIFIFLLHLSVQYEMISSQH